MRLRLGLLNEDLTERFGVSPTLLIYIYNMDQTFKQSLGQIVWPPKESIREHLPEIFLKSGYGTCRVVIDCAQVFIERPKSLSAQAATSDKFITSDSGFYDLLE